MCPLCGKNKMRRGPDFQERLSDRYPALNFLLLLLKLRPVNTQEKRERLVGWVTEELIEKEVFSECAHRLRTCDLVEKSRNFRETPKSVCFGSDSNLFEPQFSCL